MGGLYQLIKSIVFVIFIAHSAVAADYCSLVVRVLSPDGRRPEAIVSVREQSGRVVEIGPTSEDVKFCDLGIEPATVKVGSAGTCNQVTVADVPLTWQEPYLLTVTYDLEPCLEDLPPPPVPVCQVLFRVSDVKNGWLAGAFVEFQRPAIPELRTDASGRALLVAKSADTIMGTVRTDGFVSKNFSLSCRQSEQAHEEFIKLERVSR